MKKSENSAQRRRDDNITLMDTDELTANVIARGMLNFTLLNGR